MAALPERMRFHVAGTTVVIAGMAGGAVVGFWDGLFASMRAGVGAWGVLATVGLVTAVDLLVGGLVAAVAVLLLKLARWGRRTGAPPLATYAGWLVCGLGAAAVAAAAIAGTAIRNNRFLAALIVAGSTLLVAVAGALVSPAIARLFGRVPRSASRRRTAGTWHEDLTATPTGVLVLAPLFALALGAIIFVIVWRTRAPLTPSVRTTRMVLAAVVAVLLPAGITLTATRGQRLNWRAATGVALVVLGIPALLFVRANWVRHFQFLPWKDGRVLLYVIAAGLVVLLFLRWRPPRRMARLGVVLLTPPLAVGLALWAGAAEPARKAASTEAGLAGTVLALVRPALDFDKDTYPGLLGGGDCDDGNPAINPAALDWPEDGLDQDCDGRDLRAVDLRAPPLHRVPASVPRDLNILLIVIDTLRADHLGSYGYKRPTSPEIDALAADGVVFENAWAHAPSTRYSMPALVTGRWPSAIKWEPPAVGSAKWWPAFSRDHRTIAEALRPRGYFNGALYAYEYFNRTDGRGFERAIDQYDDRLAAKHIDRGGPAESVGSSAREMADDGIDFLRSYRDQKFFLTMHFYDPHLSYERHPGAPDFGSTQADLYDGEIWFTDRNVGRVIGTLRELGLYEKTAIFITGDHGEGLGEHGIVAHGYDLLAPQTKVPMIARVPGLGSRRVQEPVGHVDLAPTLINLARAPAEPTFLGRSMVDLLAGTADSSPAPEYVFQEVSFPPEPPRFPRAVERRAIASASHHLLWNQVPENTIYCYDLVNDPGENRDLWGTRAGEPACTRLKTLLDRRLSLLKLSDLPPDFTARVSASVSAPGEQAPGPPRTRMATFGDTVRFLGYKADIVGTPFPAQGPPVALGEGTAGAPEGPRGPGGTEVIRIARGGEVELTSYFQVTKDLSGWRVFFHLDGPGGTWRNLDHVPVGGAYPVDRWRAGQQIRDRFTLRFTPDYPPGLHTLHIGFWRPPSSANRRLPVTPADVQDGQDRFRVLTFAVE
jgi:arylsulfatase A-like enzyme